MGTVKTLIQIALDDIKTAEVLYHTKHNRNAFYSFQQASEKANKALGLFGGLIQEKDFKEISHHPIKIHRRAIAEEEGNIRSLLDKFKSFPGLEEHPFGNLNFHDRHTSLNESLRFIDKVQNNSLAEMTSADLEVLLEHLHELKAIKVIFKESSEVPYPTIIERVSNWYGHINPEYGQQMKKELEEYLSDHNNLEGFHNAIFQVVKGFVELFYISNVFFFCALITAHHHDSIRYPIDGIDPMVRYSKRFPLIKKQPDFSKHLKSALFKFRRLTDSIDKEA